MNKEVEFTTSAEARAVFVSDAFWALLTRPLPELPAALDPLAAVCSHEHVETWLDRTRRLAVESNDRCAMLISQSGALKKRLEEARIRLPVAVLADYMSASVNFVQPDGDEYRQRVANEIRALADVLMSFVRLHASGAVQLRQ